MWRFFERYPTPGDTARADPCEIQEMIAPLGLSERRSKTLIRMSDGYLKDDWKGNPAVLYGIGKYASDAYQIFCVGNWRDVQPKDHALNDYHNWLKSMDA